MAAPPWLPRRATARGTLERVAGADGSRRVRGHRDGPRPGGDVAERDAPEDDHSRRPTIRPSPSTETLPDPACFEGYEQTSPVGNWGMKASRGRAGQGCTSQPSTYERLAPSFGRVDSGGNPTRWTTRAISGLTTSRSERNASVARRRKGDCRTLSSSVTNARLSREGARNSRCLLRVFCATARTWKVRMARRLPRIE
jgi:hypothetical protein